QPGRRGRTPDLWLWEALRTGVPAGGERLHRPTRGLAVDLDVGAFTVEAAPCLVVLGGEFLEQFGLLAGGGHHHGDALAEIRRGFVLADRTDHLDGEVRQADQDHTDDACDDQRQRVTPPRGWFEHHWC